jgi:hypothetical protein
MDDCSTFYLASWGGHPAELERIATKVLDLANRLESAVLAVVGVASAVLPA